MEAREYTLSNVYPVIAKATGQQRSFTAHNNEFFVWRLFFEGMDGHYMTNRKGDNAPQKGDTVYGTIGEDQFGNPIFKSESRPMGQLPSNNTKTQPKNDDLDEKIDYMITMLESIQNKIGLKDIVPEDIENDPIDLSAIPF